MSISKTQLLCSIQDSVLYQHVDFVVRCQNNITRYTRALAAQDVCWKQLWKQFLIIIIGKNTHRRSLFCWPLELIQELSLLLLLKTNACRAVWVIMREVGGSFVLRVFQTHVQTSNADSSVHLVDGETRQTRVNRGSLHWHVKQSWGLLGVSCQKSLF